MDEDQSGGIVLNDLDRLARGDELYANRATEEAARLARAADKSLRLRDEFNLTRYMFQRGSVDWDPLDPNFKYYNPKEYSRWKPTSEESYEFTACKEFLQESSDYEWREKVE